MLSSPKVQTALVALAAYAVVALIQRQFPIPVVGAYLPK
jgi:hypothetical protein